MVSLNELKDDEEFSDLKEDVEEECKRFGKVVDMVIPRPQVQNHCTYYESVVTIHGRLTRCSLRCRKENLFQASETSTCALTRRPKLRVP